MAPLSWKDFAQRILLIIFVGGLVVVLIWIGVDEYVALTIAAAIIYLARGVWHPDGGGGRGGLSVEQLPPTDGATQ